MAVLFHCRCFGALMRWVSDRRLSLAREFDTVVSLFVDGAGG
jgi:hypothetical protein